MKQKRIIFLINELNFFISHRLPIAIELKKENHQILIISKYLENSKNFIKIKTLLKNNNIKYKNIDKKYFFILSEFIYFFQTFYYMFKFKPTVVNLITIKPIMFGLIISRIIGIKKIIITISGMGYFFTGKNNFIKFLVKFFFIFILKNFINKKTKIIVQNNDDKNFFIKNNIISKDKIIIISGSGVNIDEYQDTSWKYAKNIVLFPSRLLKDKGLMEFVSSAKFLKSKYKNWKFVLAGSLESNNPSKINKKLLNQWIDEDIIEWLGHVENINKIFIQSSIICLPSYREGMPKSLQEAAASERPVVTTDTTGCREVIINNVTGFLIPVKDVSNLSLAIEKLILDKELRKKFGKNGRRLALDKFDIKKIVKQHIPLY